MTGCLNEDGLGHALGERKGGGTNVVLGVMG